MRHPVFPWIILIFTAFYVLALSYYSNNRAPLDPSYTFYDSTAVEVIGQGLAEAPEVYGQFNNILEGRRQIVAAEYSDPLQQQLTFRVNSPRPAVIYVNEEAVEVILLPGDTSLKVMAYFSEEEERLDSVHFEGKSAPMAYYYKSKKQALKQQNIRASRHVVLTDDFEAYSRAVDSMAASELVFLVEQEVFQALPEWFTQFEKNEILYQKAYLKLSAAYNQSVDPSLLDKVRVSNKGAVFSYYYYLYLGSYFSHLQGKGPDIQQASYEEMLNHQLQLADSILQGAPHDVFISRLIFQQLAMDNYRLSEKLFLYWQEKFNSQKYKRYLKTQLLKHKEKSGF